MGAVLQRLVSEPGGLPKVEWLHRSGALFSECEWSWSPDSDGAHVFPDYLAAEREIAARTEGGHRPYPCTRADSRAVAQKHEEARLTQAMGGLPANVQRPTKRAGRPKRKPSGAAAWRRTLAEMERKHPHEEVYRETAKHLGERED